MIDSSLYLLSMGIFSFLIGFLVVRFRFYSITYYIKGKIVRDKLLSNVKNVHLISTRKRYGFIITIIPVLGFSWGLFGVIISCSLIFNQFFSIFSNEEIKTFLFVLDTWIIVNIVMLSIVPLLFIFTKATLPRGMKTTFTKIFFIFVIMVIIVSLVYTFLDYHITTSGLFVLFLLGIPSIFSAWYIGEYYGLFVIRSYYQLIGWDFIINGKLSIFSRLKGFFSILFAILTPILAINSLFAVIFKNTRKGGFIGISITNFITFNLNFDFKDPFTFVRPSFIFLGSVIIVFLIVGPLVTFIFRPTNMFELSLNSNIYTTLSNFNWEYFNEYANSSDGIIFDALTIHEMVGILILFISFINYVALLSVGALSSSFGINIISSLGLSTINGTTKLIEIPVLFFIQFVMLHDLSEERQLVKLASLSKKNHLITPKMVPGD